MIVASRTTLALSGILDCLNTVTQRNLRSLSHVPLRVRRTGLSHMSGPSNRCRTLVVSGIMIVISAAAALVFSAASCGPA